MPCAGIARWVSIRQEIAVGRLSPSISASLESRDESLNENNAQLNVSYRADPLRDSVAAGAESDCGSVEREAAVV